MTTSLDHAAKSAGQKLINGRRCPRRADREDRKRLGNERPQPGLAILLLGRRFVGVHMSLRRQLGGQFLVGRPDRSEKEGAMVRRVEQKIEQRLIAMTARC